MKTSFVLPRSLAPSSSTLVFRKPVISEDPSSKVGVPVSSEAMTHVVFLKRTSTTESALGLCSETLLLLTNDERRIFLGGEVEVASGE